MEKRKVVVLSLLSLLLLPAVYAQSSNLLTGFYNSYYGWIDFCVLLLIFISGANLYLGKLHGEGAEGGNGKTGLALGLGLLMALSLTLWEVSSGFTLASFGPIAFGILVIGGFVAAFSWIISKFSGGEKKGWLTKLSGGILIILVLVILAALWAFYPGFFIQPWNILNGDLTTVLFIVILVALIGTILFYLSKKYSGGSTTPGTTPAGGTTTPGTTGSKLWGATKAVGRGLWTAAKFPFGAARSGWRWWKGRFTVDIIFDKKTLVKSPTYIQGTDREIRATVRITNNQDQNPTIRWVVQGIPLTNPNTNQIVVPLNALQLVREKEDHIFMVEVTDKVLNRTEVTKATVTIARGATPISYIRMILNGQRNNQPDIPGRAVTVNEGATITVGAEVVDNLNAGDIHEFKLFYGMGQLQTSSHPTLQPVPLTGQFLAEHAKRGNTVTLPRMQEGEYTLVLRVYDQAGNIVPELRDRMFIQVVKPGTGTSSPKTATIEILAPDKDAPDKDAVREQGESKPFKFEIVVHGFPLKIFDIGWSLLDERGNKLTNIEVPASAKTQVQANHRVKVDIDHNNIPTFGPITVGEYYVKTDLLEAGTIIGSAQRKIKIEFSTTAVQPRFVWIKPSADAPHKDAVRIEKTKPEFDIEFMVESPVENEVEILMMLMDNVRRPLGKAATGTIETNKPHPFPIDHITEKYDFGAPKKMALIPGEYIILIQISSKGKPVIVTERKLRILAKNPPPGPTTPPVQPGTPPPRIPPQLPGKVPPTHPPTQPTPPVQATPRQIKELTMQLGVIIDNCPVINIGIGQAVNEIRTKKAKDLLQKHGIDPTTAEAFINVIHKDSLDRKEYDELKKDFERLKKTSDKQDKKQIIGKMQVVLQKLDHQFDRLTKDREAIEWLDKSMKIMRKVNHFDLKKRIIGTAFTVKKIVKDKDLLENLV